MNAIQSQLLSLTRKVFIGISGRSLTDEETNWLRSEKVGGVILFARNYESKAQLKALTDSIKAVRSELLISVDHEGGRVQRFRDGFTQIPPMRTLGDAYDFDPDKALLEATEYGETIGRELQDVGVDFSYTPVCDLDFGLNSAIGDRAFHYDPYVVAKLAAALHKGLNRAGSVGIAKHFPGHGYVAADTHLEMARDTRTLDELWQFDLIPFREIINAGIEGVMPSHIIYDAIDPDYSAVSSKKCMTFLREELDFQGVIISDDLDMKAADALGDVHDKVAACFNAGIDIVLLCNDFDAIRAYLA